MAKCQWVILCERAIVEDQAGTISLVSMLEQLNCPPPPEFTPKHESAAALLPFRFYVVHQWARSKPKVGERVAVRALLFGPDGKQFGSQEAVVDLTKHTRGRIIGQVLGIPVRKEGIYRCEVQSKVATKWRKAGEAEFTLAFVGAQRH